MLRNTILKLTFLAASVAAQADTPAIHGMLLFGLQKTYVSHLPMFHAPHDYQHISEVILEDLPRSFVLSQYKKLQNEGQSLFTLEPSKTDLTQIIDGTQKTLLARLYQGHFERNGKLLGSVIINFEKTIYSAKLNASSFFPTEDQYVVFGKMGEYFAAHIIQGKPNLDLIAKVSAPFTFTPSPCNRRACPDFIRNSIPDSSLPILVSNGTQRLPNPTSLQAGENIGPGFPTSQVLDIIYEERAELSH